LIDNLSEDKNYQVEFNGEGYIEYRSEKWKHYLNINKI
jgi:hypothetical protein